MVAVVAELGGAGTSTFRRIDAAGCDGAMRDLGVSVRVPAPGRPDRDPGDVREATVPLRRLADFDPDAVVGAIPGLALLREARAMAPEPLRRGGGAAAVLPPSPAAWQATVDRLLDAHVHAILDHPRLRMVEAAWRGIDALVRGVAGLPDVEVHVLDVPRAAVADGSGVARAVAGLPGPVRALVCGWDVGPEAADVAPLDALGAAAAGAGVPCLAGATPALVGVTAAGPALDRLRRSPVAAHLALVVPRALVRPWHDPATVAGFSFDEAAAPGATPFWGGSAFVAALALAGEARGDPRVVAWPGPLRLETALDDTTTARLTAAGCLVLAPVPGAAALKMLGARTLSGTPIA